MRLDARRVAAVALICCGLAVAAHAQPDASEQSGRREQRQDAQEPQSQARETGPPEQAEPRAQDRQGEQRNRAENDPGDEKGEPDLLAWAGRLWSLFVGFVEANDKFLVALGTLVTAAFTAILGGATIGLFVATRNLVKGAERTAERQLRAYIGVAENKADGIAPNIKPTIELALQNFGQTPAYDLVIWTEISVMEPAAAAFTDRSHAEPGRRVMNPGAVATVPTTKDEALTEDEFMRIKADAARLYCFGTIRYTDAFGKARTTKFRLETRGGRLLAVRSLPLSDEGNEAD